MLGSYKMGSLEADLAYFSVRCFILGWDHSYADHILYGHESPETFTDYFLLHSHRSKFHAHRNDDRKSYRGPKSEKRTVLWVVLIAVKVFFSGQGKGRKEKKRKEQKRKEKKKKKRKERKEKKRKEKKEKKRKKKKEKIQNTPRPMLLV